MTACTQNRECLFGGISNGEMRSNYAGQMVKESWVELMHKFKNIELDEFVVMPNHVHGIVVIVEDPCRGGSRTARKGFVQTTEQGNS